MTRPAWISGGAEPGAASMAGNLSAPLLQAARIPAGRVHLDGDLSLPPAPRGLVVFAHGSGSSRHSVRNRYVAQVLNMHGLATLLLDLLTPAEDVGGAERFDIDLLSARLAAAVAWVRGHATLHALPIGLFGASTGAASALRVASTLPAIGAVVSRGGRPDLVMDDLPAVQAPVLLIVGSLDHDVLQLNEKAYAKLNCEKKLEVVAGATHLFEEHGMMEKVAALASQWFMKHLVPVDV